MTVNNNNALGSAFDSKGFAPHLASMNQVDVLCIGYACWDLNFRIESHPGPDDKIFAESLTSEGGGPAANAAYSIAKLGGRAALVSRLGKDTLGKAHLKELQSVGVDTSCISFSDTQTSTSSVWVNPKGQRAIVNFKPERADELPAIGDFQPKCLLIDGHEYEASISALETFSSIPSVLDAGSLSESTRDLSKQVTHLVASSTFAQALAQSDTVDDWLEKLKEHNPCFAITHGSEGIYWHAKGGDGGHIKAQEVDAIDTTAAGDIFHGACAWALAKGKSFPGALSWANEIAALSVTRLGGRSSTPSANEVSSLDSVH